MSQDPSFYFTGANSRNYLNTSHDFEPDTVFAKKKQKTPPKTLSCLAGEKCRHINLQWLSVWRCCMEIGPVFPPNHKWDRLSFAMLYYYLRSLFHVWKLIPFEASLRRSAALHYLTSTLSILAPSWGVMFYWYVGLWMGLFNAAGRWGALQQ